MQNILDYIKTKLNNEQFDACINIDTSSLIIAGAGSGKTRTLTYKIAYLIFGKDIFPSQILAVTFTNKAANEMKERLIELGKEFNSIIGSNYNIDKKSLKWIGTFHSIFLKILKEDIENANDVLKTYLYNSHNFTKGFTILDTNDTTSVIKGIIKKLGLKDEIKPNECKGYISKQKSLGLTYKMQGDSDNYKLSEIYKEYQIELSKNNALDFDDLLLFPYLIFKYQPEILSKWQKKFKYIMVDEAQDTNRIQFELMKKISGNNSVITLIGDDFQSIYGRRGAMMENFLNVKKYWTDIKIFKLQTNYRSKPHIVEAGNRIIEKNKYQYKKNVVPFRKGNEKIMLFSHNSDIDEASFIIKMIQKFKEDNKIKSRGDVAILYRTNSQSSTFESILVQEGLPYKIYGAFKFFERKEIKDILAYLNYIFNETNNISLKRIINLPNRKIGKTTIEKLNTYAVEHNISLNETILNVKSFGIKITPTAINGINNFLFKIKNIKDQISELYVSDIIKKIITAIDYKGYLIKEEGNQQKAEEKFENIGQLINMASNIDDKGKVGLEKFLNDISLLTDVLNNKEEDADSIKLMTLHASKGLEFPIVFLTGLEENLFPLGNSTLEPKLLEEERRLMYVGITRAKNTLFFSYAKVRQKWGSFINSIPSRFINEIPEDLIKSFNLNNNSTREVKKSNISFYEGDTVKHGLLGKGIIQEVYGKYAIVKFENGKIKRISIDFLEII